MSLAVRAFLSFGETAVGPVFNLVAGPKIRRSPGPGPANAPVPCSAPPAMSLIQIAWRNFRYRSLSSLLTTFSLALGVALVVLVLAIYGIVYDAFRRNSSVSYNLVVGPKGSALQLTLNSVYYLSQPIENLPYTGVHGVHDSRTAS